ncbi:MAG: hypothetical protein AAF799_28985 [Myxococcota bacterium]
MSANAPADDVVTMSTSDTTTCASTASGKAKCWGANDAGQLGRGDTMPHGDDEPLTELAAIDLDGFVVDVQTNGRQTFALIEDGRVFAWGDNGNGELGLGHTQTMGDDEPINETEFVVDLGGAAAIQLAVGDGFACALLEDGAVRCWGANDVGQLGYGHTDTIGDDETPASSGSVSLWVGAVQITAGADHACALLDNGHVRCWGLNDAGQLGYGHTDTIGDDERPGDRGPIPLGDDGVVELVAGERHTCARFETGGVRCWGANEFGQLGYGHTDSIGDDECPAVAGDVAIGAPIVAFDAGARHTCAISSEGGLYCWGDGLDGQLGYGTDDDIGDDESPQMAGSLDLQGHLATSVFIGPTASSTCVRLEDGHVRCWGLNDLGQLGYADTETRGNTPSTTPGRIPDVVVADDDDD